MHSIGIELGTTNSLVSVSVDGHPRVLANELDEIMTASVVAIAEDGALLVGRAARDRLVTDPSQGVACFKRDMGTEKTYQFGGKTWTPVELSACILKEMKRIAELRLGEEVTSAVISVPAYFHDAPRQATIDAAEIAGVRVERLINEPTAAALAYGCQNKEADSTLMVFDIGGGTFDVTVLEIFEQVIDVKSSGGISRLGGEDYLDCLLACVAAKLSIDQCEEMLLAKLRPKVEVLKRQLSEADVAQLEWFDDTITVTRQEFAACTQDLSDRLRPVVVKCLRDAQLSLRELESVILVGGASRMHVIHKIVGGLSNDQVLDNIDPDLVVVQGAAVQASLVSNDDAVKDMVLTDVAPHSLGVSISRELRPNYFEEGIFSPIIDRNSTLPISRSNVYQSLSATVDELDLQIYQGEHRYVKDNHRLGSIRVKGLRGKPGQEDSGLCDVRFTYDMNGILEIDVTALATKKKTTAVIEERPGHLTKDEIAKAIKRLQPLKINLRDLLPNRARIERAIRLYEDLNGAYREHLGQLLEQFESALAQEDKQAVAWTGTALDQFIDGFYVHEKERMSLDKSDVELPSQSEELSDADEPERRGPWLPDDEPTRNE